jgi:hypothetical protein
LRTVRRALPRALATGLIVCATGTALAACGKAHDLSTEQLSRVVEQNRPALKTCYDDALEKHPYTQDMHMSAILHIATSGQVASIKFEGGSGLPGMQDCLRTQIKAWQFPKAQDETATSLPLVFHPEVVKKLPPGSITLEDLLKQEHAGK